MEMRRIRWVGGADALVEAVVELPESFVLESSLRANGLGRYTFAGLQPIGEFVFRVEDLGKALGHPLTALEQWFHRYSSKAPGERSERFPFTGGAVGFLAYEAAVAGMPTVGNLPMEPRLPLIEFKAYDGIFIFDHEEGSLHVVAHGWEEPAEQILDRLEALAETVQTLPPRRGTVALKPGAVVSNFTAETYGAAVERARQYIRSGEVYQVNLAQRFEVHVPGASAAALYQHLRSRTAAPYSAFLPITGAHLLSCSPEQLLCRTGRRLTSRPIKGTRPRGATEQQDAELKAALAASEKDRAELLMIVDLVRNDLGRVAETGSVEVSGLFNLETYPSVFHQTARVSALAAANLGFADCLGAVFPGGSITGAPKIRAMQIISELEQMPRGAYTGAIGWLDPCGDFEFNIAIRTATLIGETLSYHAGAGIVWDSVATAEYEETLDKAAGFFRALGASFRI